MKQSEVCNLNVLGKARMERNKVPTSQSVRPAGKVQRALRLPQWAETWVTLRIVQCHAALHASDGVACRSLSFTFVYCQKSIMQHM